MSEYEHNEHLLDEIQRLRESNFHLRKDCEEQKNRIKRLEEELNELRSDESRLLNSNGEFERRINRLLEAGDKMANSTDIREYSVAIQNWTKANEAKP